MINATWHDTYRFGLMYYGPYESLAAPPPQNTKINGTSGLRPGHQDLCPINAKTTRIWNELCNAATWLIQTIAYKLGIDLHDYRTQSEPLLSFIPRRLTWWGNQNQVQVLHGAHQC